MEKTTKLKVAGSVMSAALIMGGTVAAIPGAALAQNACKTPDASALFAEQAAQAGIDTEAVRTVEGEFTYSQEALTSNKQISDVFCKAATSLCQGLPTYDAAVPAANIAITAPNVSFEATVEDLSDGEDYGAIVGCACATNGPGGGAIVNADIQGVTLQAIASIATAIS